MFEALFLWITFLLASLSTIEMTAGSFLEASALSVFCLRAFTALRVVLA
jgi:hypothetical protein